MIIQVNVVLNRTNVDNDWHFDSLCGCHLQSQSELYLVSWWYLTLVIDLIGPLSRDVIGRLSLKPWCFWLWWLMSLVPFDSPIVWVKQSFIVQHWQKIVLTFSSSFSYTLLGKTEFFPWMLHCSPQGVQQYPSIKHWRWSQGG